jgi:hypothetical protein
LRERGGRQCRARRQQRAGRIEPQLGIDLLERQVALVALAQRGGDGTPLCIGEVGDIEAHGQAIAATREYPSVGRASGYRRGVA